MIRIRFEEPQTEVWRTWIDECLVAAKALKDAFRWGEPFAISGIYGKRDIKQTVFMAPDGPFKGRCAYCEARVLGSHHGDVDHFRPKRAVIDESDKPILVDCPDGIRRQHPGYYWLAYDWRNLLLSCVACNQSSGGKRNKHSRFPVVGGCNAVTEAELVDEKPLLINPADPHEDDPEDHFEIEFDTGVLKYRSARGDMCIKVFGLNRQDSLVPDRRTAMEDLLAKYVKVANGGTVGDEAKQEIIEMKAGSHPYTFARRAQYEELRRRTEI